METEMNPRFVHETPVNPSLIAFGNRTRSVLTSPSFRFTNEHPCTPPVDP